jgi:hypothetical protein
MDAPAQRRRVKINRWLPYWAVLQADVHMTLRSWVYRVWLFVSLLTTGAYLIFHIALQQKAGLLQPASLKVSDLLFWSFLAGVTLIILLTGGSISSERGTMADSVLSRGVSRYQYFLGKWHARVAVVLGTFFCVGLFGLLGSHFFLHEDLSLDGSLMALATIMALLTAVTTCGVTVSAIANSTVFSIALLWIGLYGVGFTLSRLPGHYSTPVQTLVNLPYVLQGFYDGHVHGRIILWSLLASVLVASVGLGYFSRRDV